MNTFFEQLQAHRGGLVRLRSELFWYSRGWDDSPGRVGLVLDAFAAEAWFLAAARTRAALRGAAVATLLLIDGSPQWVWVDEEDVEVLG
jgi:hypothetical protein